MYQIAIGDPSAGFTIIEGHSVTAPYNQAAVFFTFAPGPILKENIVLTLKGTPAQITTALSTLELIIARALDFKRAAYPSSQYLRFQLTAGGSYYITPISNIYLESNPAGYKSHQTGSLLLTLHYQRPNWFDGPQTELPLTGSGGTDITGGFSLFNHTDHHAGHGSTALIKKADVVTELPAPLRIELTNTYAAPNAKDILVGSFYHPSSTDFNLFFAQAHNMSGGVQNYDVLAIGDYYRRLTWSATAFSPILYYSLSAGDTNILDGRTYQPIIRLFNPHAYDDLYLQLRLKRGTDTLFTGDPIFANKAYQYIIFPPVEIPPNQLLRETLPHFVECVFYARKVSGLTYTLDVDQLMLLPLDFPASFLGFFPFRKDNILIDDSHRQQHNVQASHIGSETVSHIRQGGQLLLMPNANTRLFFNQSSVTDQLDVMRTSSVKVFYRPRKRLL